MGRGRVFFLALPCLLLAALFAGGVSSASAAAPQISEELPVAVDRDSATLQAKVNPNGLATEYRFEWGTDTSYGHRMPAETDEPIGAGASPVVVSATLSGLEEGTVYHYRVVATSTAVTEGPDRQFETLNSCGLAQDRCFELVSPVDKGPVGEAGGAVGLPEELQMQVSADGSKAAYVLGYGLPSSTSGGEVVYQSNREPGGWLAAQLSPPVREQTVLEGPLTLASKFLLVSDDFQCGFLLSAQRLTPDMAAMPVIEAGGMNIYRYGADGSYDLVTPAPTNPGAAGIAPLGAYGMVGASSDCERVVFTAQYEYPGVGFSAGLRRVGLYEWDEGTLRNPGLVPSSSGPQVTEARAGAGGGIDWNAVSSDGSRVFFTAVSKLGGDTGKQAVFLRENGTTTVDVSQSQGPRFSNQIQYQLASEEGDQVFFIGNYGLKAAPGAGWPVNCTVETGQGCSLYRYSVETGTLTDVAPDANPADPQGPNVAGVLDASDDGSYVYFAARGQLLPGKGKSLVQNLAGEGSYNVYLSHEGAVSFVGTVAQTDRNSLGGLLIDQSEGWSSRATPDGRHLLFQSKANVTGYDSGGVREAFLYSADTDTTVCVSCRRDGLPSVGSAGTAPIPRRVANSTPASPPGAISEDGSRVFFNMPDALAVGARSGETNLYEWHEGQISLLATEFPEKLNGAYGPRFGGASTDGDTVLFRTKQALVPQDTDLRQDVYAAVVGGGFAPPPPSPAPCDPLVEGSCQGPAFLAGTSNGAPASATASSTGNVKPKPGKAKKHKRKHKSKKKHKRPAKTDRRTAK